MRPLIAMKEEHVRIMSSTYTRAKSRTLPSEEMNNELLN
jgi:hypothetical protein